MEARIRAKLMYDNIDQIKKDILSGRLNSIKIWTDFSEDEEVVNMWIENEYSESGSTIMLDLDINDALFLGKALVAMCSKNNK